MGALFESNDLRNIGVAAGKHARYVVWFLQSVEHSIEQLN